MNEVKASREPLAAFRTFMGPWGGLDLTPGGGGNKVIAQIRTRRNQVDTRCWSRNQTSELSVSLLRPPGDVSWASLPSSLLTWSG